MLLQFGGWQTSFTSLRNDISCGWVAHFLTNMFLFCTPMEASSTLKNSENGNGHLHFFIWFFKFIFDFHWLYNSNILVSVSQWLLTKRRIKYLLQEQEGQDEPPGPSLLLPPPASQQAVHQHNSIGTSRGDWRRGGRGGFRARGSSNSHRNRHGRRHHQAAATSRWRWLKLRPMSNYCSMAVVRKKCPGAGILSLVLGVDWIMGQAIQ